MNDSVDVAVIGAGPYGLSIAAFLRKTKLRFRVFGKPMQSWGEQMPKGMMMKSEGFASDLFDPESAFTLGDYCAEKGIPYEDVGLPVTSAVFVAYGKEFQRRMVPNLEPVDICSVQKTAEGFALTTAAGETFEARQVVVAAGITHFGYVPPVVAGLPPEYLSHSLGNHDLSRFAGKRVVVLGAGASAVDLAALLYEAGAEVEMIARRKSIAFHEPTQEPRPLKDRVMMPRSGLGLGWRSKLCTDAPLVFHRMPRNLRVRVVQRHLGPAPGWFVRDKVVGRFPQHMGATLQSAVVEEGKVWLDWTGQDGAAVRQSFDHVISATGFRVDVTRLRFLDEGLLAQVRCDEQTPVLSRSFESSVPGLYFVGLASANSFGPLTRFAYGAGFTAKRISRHLATVLRVRRRRGLEEMARQDARVESSQVV